MEKIIPTIAVNKPDITGTISTSPFLINGVKKAIAKIILVKSKNNLPTSLIVSLFMNQLYNKKHKKENES